MELGYKSELLPRGCDDREGAGKWEQALEKGTLKSLRPPTAIVAGTTVSWQLVVRSFFLGFDIQAIGTHTTRI